MGYIFLLPAGLMTPFVVVLIMIFGSKDAALKKDFINRLVNPRLSEPKILAFFFLVMPLVVLVSIALSLPFGGSVKQFQFAEEFSFSTGCVPVLRLLLLAAAFGELGWRGYTFDSLERRCTYFTASIMFSVLWSLWRLPLSFVQNSYQSEIFLKNIWYGLNFYVSIIPMGVIISWICLKN